MNRFLQLPGKFMHRLFQHGPRDVCWWLWNHWETRRRERQFGIDTAAVIQPEELGYAPDATGYDPISYANMDAILDSLTIDSKQDVFVDIGSGLGRAVFMAATRPFKKVIGIELNHDLYTSSVEQLERARPHLTCQDIELVEADATQWDMPADASVLFIWNSFLGDILHRVLQRIQAHHAQHQKPITLIYAIPDGDPDTLSSLPWLSDRQEIPPRFWTGIRVFRYRVA